MTLLSCTLGNGFCERVADDIHMHPASTRSWCPSVVKHRCSLMNRPRHGADARLLKHRLPLPPPNTPFQWLCNLLVTAPIFCITSIIYEQDTQSRPSLWLPCGPLDFTASAHRKFTPLWRSSLQARNRSLRECTSTCSTYWKTTNKPHPFRSNPHSFQRSKLIGNTCCPTV